jgi:hypothetical protein
MVVRRVIGTTRSYAWATHAGLTRLGSNVMPTSRVLLLLWVRRATLLSLLRWGWALQRVPAVQRSPQKAVPIVGA